MSDAMDTEYVVLRPANHIDDNDMPRSYEGEWRKRADLPDDASVELLGPSGNVWAYPTDRTETDPDGNVAQLYEVPEDAATLESSD